MGNDIETDRAGDGAADRRSNIACAGRAVVQDDAVAGRAGDIAVVVSEISPVPFWVTTMPLAAPFSAPVGVSTILARLTLVPPDAVKSSASPLDVVMSAAPVTVNVPPFDDRPAIVPVKLWPATLSS